MRWVAALVACGCNSIFGLHETSVIDAPYYDAPVDAPFQCPALGTPLQFSAQLHQLDVHGCDGYTRAGDQLAVAICDEGGQRVVYQGPVDGTLTPATVTDPGDTILSATLTPEGDELFVSTEYTGTTGGMFIYDRQGDGSWLRGADPPLGPLGFISNPARGPAHRLLYSHGSASDLYEWAQDSAGTWQQVHVHAIAALGISNTNSLWLSGDGLRLITNAFTVADPLTEQMLYLDRDTVAETFRPAVVMTTLPLVLDAFVTDDCARIYMSGLASIFYAQQL
jgi:hypothetical protein